MALQKKRGAINSDPLNSISSTGESFRTNQRYKKRSIVQSFFDQFNTIEKQFYLNSIVKLQKVLNDGN